MRTLLLALLLAVLLVGCGGGTSGTDARLASPERTVQTLLSAYGLDRLSQDEIRARLAARARFEMRDRASFEACFADLDGTPARQGLAGWVLGALAAGKDELRTETVGERATVSPRPGVRIVLARQRDRSWRIVLAESVPPEARRGLAMLAEQHERRLRRRGAVP